VPRPGKRILVVDDEDLFRRSVKQAFAAAQPDLEVLLAANGAEALQLVDKHRIDVVVTDLKMPVMDGIQLLQELMARKLTAPVVVLTAHGTPELERQAALSGSVFFLEKPVGFDVLLPLVRELVDRPATHVEGILLAGFVQLLQMERRTGVLRVRSGERVGVLELAAGELVDDGAALDVLAWADTTCDFHPKAGNKQVRTVTRALGELLMEAARLDDERNSGLFFEEALTGSPPSVDSSPFSSPPTLRPQHEATRNPMANVTETLNEAMNIEGAIGVALADWESGLCLGVAGGGSRLNMEVAAAANCAVVRAKMTVMTQLGIKGAIHDMLITLDDQIHLIRPLTRYSQLFLYVAIDKAKGNLAMARFKVTELEKSLSL
jgi:CheY-like chemotaxis protein